MERYEPVTHCIFDLDGLLLNTEVVYEKIVADICESYGKTYTQDVRFKLLGTTERRSAEIVCELCELPITVDEYLVTFKQLCLERLGKSDLMNGARCLLCHLHKNKVPFALATSSAENMFILKTEIHRNIFNLFHHYVCGSTDPEVKVGKPSPDIFLVAARRFPDNPEPSKCLVFEDAPNGVQAAVAAGMQVIMVPDPRVPEESRKNATLVLKSLKDFKPEKFGLPPFSILD